MRFGNRTKQLLILRLNSGATVHLAPGEVSSPIDDYETDNNSHLEKLLRSEAIAAAGDTSAAASVAGPARASHGGARERR